MKNIKASVYIIAALIAISCQPVTAVTTNPIPTVKTTVLSHQEILTHLLLADMALQRNMPEVALENYMIVAKYTRDPEVAQLATEIAIQLQLSEPALAAAEVWADSAPTDLQAQLVAVTLYVNSNPDKAAKFLSNAFKANTQDIDQHLLLIINKLPEAGQKNLSNAVFALAKQNETNPYIQLAAAQLAAVQLNIEYAVNKVQLALKLKPDLTSALQLNAKLIRYQQNSDQPALAYLEQQVKKFPKDSELRMFYITALIDNNMADKAIPQLQTLSKDPIFGGEALLSLGELYITTNKYPLAETTIKQALKFENSADKANYYLGQLAEHNNDNNAAIEHYERVGENSEFNVPSFMRAAYLYSVAGNYPKALIALQNSNPSTFFDQKQILLTEVDVLIDAKDYEKALEEINQAIAVLPDDVDFLYARSVVYGLLNQPAESEKDLRAIINTEPNNANALNALGFTLANQPARISEAMPLLQKAISINPDNPAFMDSMGWLLYKMGKNKESIEILERAYKLSGDSEIAAHYGEVLWASGNKQSAIEIWNQALLNSPHNQHIIHDTLHRLNISLSTLKQGTIPAAKSQVRAKAKN